MTAPTSVRVERSRDTLPALALAELEHRIAFARGEVAARRVTFAQAQLRLRPWAAIAAWFGADVRPLLVPQPGVYRPSAHGEPVEPPAWIDFCPPGERADAALRRLAGELRNAALRLHARHEALLRDPSAHPEQRDSACRRASALIKLDDRLSVAAGAGPIILSPEKAA